MLNHVSLMGRLTRSPELRNTHNGISVTSFTVAVDRDYGRAEDKQTDFIDIVCWRQTAEFACKYFHKGSLIAVSGRLQTRRWEDKEGAKRTAVEVVADNVYFAERKRDGGQESSPTPAQGDEPGGFYEMEDDGDVPF